MFNLINDKKFDTDLNTKEINRLIRKYENTEFFVLFFLMTQLNCFIFYAWYLAFTYQPN